MHIPGLLLAVSGALAAHKYDVAIRGEDNTVLDFGTLDLHPAQAAPVAKFTPSEPALQIPRNGCLGVKGPEGFVCQTIFRDLESEDTGAIKAVIGSDGSLTQVQLVEGKPGQVFIDVPKVIPGPVLKPAKPSGDKQSSKERSKNAWKEKKQGSAEDEQEEEEKTFIEKYWMYSIPIIFVIATNVMGGGGSS